MRNKFLALVLVLVSVTPMVNGQVVDGKSNVVKRIGDYDAPNNKIEVGSTIIDGNDLRLRGYLFGAFEDAKVMFKNGRTADYKMNYYAVMEKFHFLDRAGQLQELVNPATISYIAIKDRLFFIEENGQCLEKICKDPELYVSYKCNVRINGDVEKNYRKENSSSTYGLRSATAQDETYFGASQAIAVKMTVDEFNFDVIKREYKIVIDGKTKKFKNLGGFTKLFKKEKRSEIEKYAQDSKVNFNNPQQVIELSQYAMSL